MAPIQAMGAETNIMTTVLAQMLRRLLDRVTAAAEQHISRVRGFDPGPIDRRTQ